MMTTRWAMPLNVFIVANLARCEESYPVPLGSQTLKLTFYVGRSARHECINFWRQVSEFSAIEDSDLTTHCTS